MNLAQAEKNTILRCTVGSTSLGLSLDGGSDRDEMGILIEDIEDHVTLNGPFDQFIHRDAALREGQHDAASQAGDLDLTLYSLRKFCRLAINGNPNLISLLFIPHEYHTTCDAFGHVLQDMAPMFISRSCASHYLGYMQAQQARLMGLQGQKRIKRPELESQFGYDTKYAMHMLRLGFNGIELLSTGRLSFPMVPSEKDFLMEVRLGQVSLQDVMTTAGTLERQLKDLKIDSPLQEKAQDQAIESWMRAIYFEHWKARGYQE